MAGAAWLNRQSTIDVSAFQQRLLTLRVHLDLTQEQFAKRVGVSLQLIYRWENGLGMPDIRNLVKLCKALNVSADFLLGLQYEVRGKKQKGNDDGSE